MNWHRYLSLLCMTHSLNEDTLFYKCVTNNSKKNKPDPLTWQAANPVNNNEDRFFLSQYHSSIHTTNPK